MSLGKIFIFFLLKLICELAKIVLRIKITTLIDEIESLRFKLIVSDEF